MQAETPICNPHKQFRITVHIISSNRSSRSISIQDLETSLEESYSFRIKKDGSLQSAGKLRNSLSKKGGVSTIIPLLSFRNYFLRYLVIKPKSMLTEVPSERMVEIYTGDFDECTLEFYLKYWDQIEEIHRRIDFIMNRRSLLLMTAMAAANQIPGLDFSMYPQLPNDIRDAIILVKTMMQCDYPSPTNLEFLLHAAEILQIPLTPEQQDNSVVLCQALSIYWQKFVPSE